MPDKDVETILDLIYYQYTKIIVRGAFGANILKSRCGVDFNRWLSLVYAKSNWNKIFTVVRQV